MTLQHQLRSPSNSYSTILFPDILHSGGNKLWKWLKNDGRLKGFLIRSMFIHFMWRMSVYPKLTREFSVSNAGRGMYACICIQYNCICMCVHTCASVYIYLYIIYTLKKKVHMCTHTDMLRDLAIYPFIFYLLSFL